MKTGNNLRCRFCNKPAIMGRVCICGGDTKGVWLRAKDKHKLSKKVTKK